MRINLSASILAIIASLTSITPVFANPLGQLNSLLNGNNLAANPQSLCTDIIGQQVVNDKGKTQENDTGKDQTSGKTSYAESHDESWKNAGGGGFSVIGIGANGQGEKGGSKSDKVAENTENTANSEWDRTIEEEHDRSTISNIAVGKDCSALVTATGQRDQALFNAISQTEIATVNAKSEVDIAAINAEANKAINLEKELTTRAAVNAKAKVQLQDIETQAQVSIVNLLLEDWSRPQQTGINPVTANLRAN
ncbi:MAG TPA: hypothetical protein DEG17_00220 [Cyanobacteria bacterium UBA11149]|nr:hypothetical protein [Cyanobacteria bacterium UBA11367]HBE59652.1 hypothetical protein [Cyanobacteria bacterium UBA11366]HBK66163.1 hypothetical protein [Cyanobacteria bacterium UBA11166]HBR75835.1 hypothetical protein [Cyanobacteria bacterium UBA11159]HBS72562.1 hypothetical protein [Cyanobacteria bacterium UBA11153]HBW87346.1 hypothetical protein [Cyanobacteria bacterium UBA11149]HCA97568.1 hypothetical protein [Cyanobacteria bacterium UBA9226]